MCEVRRKGPTLCRTGRQASFLAPSHSTGSGVLFNISHSTVTDVCSAWMVFLSFSNFLLSSRRTSVGAEFSPGDAWVPVLELHLNSRTRKSLVFVLCPEPFCPVRFSPACLLYFGLDFLEILVQIQQRRGLFWLSSHSRASFMFALNIHLAQHPSRTPCHGVKKRSLSKFKLLVSLHCMVL